MTPEFKTWIETTPGNLNTINPTFALRSWDELSDDEKLIIIKHLVNLKWFENYKDYALIVHCISELNNNYKVKTFGSELFNMGGPVSDDYNNFTEKTEKAAMSDFYRILRSEAQDVVYELLSYFAKSLIVTNYSSPDASDESINEAYATFDRFSNAVNDIFNQFAINISLSRVGFIPKQEAVTFDLVIAPTFKSLSGAKWGPVQLEFAEALAEYKKGSSSSYSNSITHIVTAVQAYLQIAINGKIGKGDIDKLLKDALSKGIVSDDALTKKVMSGLQSELMQYRQKQSDAHPKKEYANEKSVRLLLNTACVFIQHCIS